MTKQQQQQQQNNDDDNNSERILFWQVSHTTLPPTKTVYAVGM
jgi:hypothetical protein